MRRRRNTTKLDRASTIWFTAAMVRDAKRAAQLETARTGVRTTYADLVRRGLLGEIAKINAAEAALESAA